MRVRLTVAPLSFSLSFEAIINLLKSLGFSDQDRQKLALEIDKELASEQKRIDKERALSLDGSLDIK